MTEIVCCLHCGSSKVVSEGFFDLTVMQCRACGYQGAAANYEIDAWYRAATEDDHHRCEGALLVGPDEPLPVDPVEFRCGEEHAIIGCTRLRCDRCQKVVRVAPDPLPKDAEGRSYECECRRYCQIGPCRRTDEEGELEDALPWSCAGHPIATLPLVLDGMSIATSSDAQQLMQRTLGGWSPDGARISERNQAVGWAIKLYVRLIDTGMEHGVACKAAECATSADARTQAAALWFLAVFPECAGAERIERLVAGERSFFANVPDPTRPGAHSLEERLLRALGRRVAHSQRALELAKREVLRPGASSVLLPFLEAVGRS